MTTIQTIIWGAATWMPRERPSRAVMPILVTCERRTSALVVDLCWELDRALDYLTFGESVIPQDSFPLGVVSDVAAMRTIGAVIVSIDPNQAAPTYEMGSTQPSISEVRLLLTQPVGKNLSDLELLIARRDDLLDVLGPLTGVLRGAPDPVPEPHVFTGRPWGRAWSKSWGPNFE